jgi:hypothetical protein
VGWILEGIVQRRWRFAAHPFLAVLVFYLGWNIMAAAFSVRPSHSLGAVVDNEWPSLIMLMMFWTIDDVQFLKNISKAFFITAGLAMVYALWQTFDGVEFYRKMTLDWIGGYYRAVGFYSFYLTFGALAMIVFFLAAACALEFQTLRLRYLALAAGSFLAIIGSFARSIWLSLALGIPLLGFLKNKTLGATITIATALFVALALYSEPTIRYRAESIFDLSQNQTRWNLWRTSLNIAAAHPIRGVGEDNFDAVFPQFKVEGYYDTTVHPHNDYLTVLVSSGIPGLAAFVALWVIAFRTGLKAWKRTQLPELRAIALGGSLSLFGLMIAAFFQNYYGSFINCLGWWFVVGLIFTAHRLACLTPDAQINS